MNRNGYGGIDRFRLIAALLVVAVHTFPLVSLSPLTDFILTHVLARVAVPFFLMATGFFLLPAMLPFLKHKNTAGTGRNSTKGHKIFSQEKKVDYKALKIYLKKTAFIYLLVVLMYLPLNIYTGRTAEMLKPSSLIRELAFGGTFYHLWYLPASMLGLLAVCILLNSFNWKGVLFITGLLYTAALLGDSYYGLALKFDGLKNFYDLLFICFDYTGNGLLMAPVFIALGGGAALSGRNYPVAAYAAGLSASITLLVTEGLFLKQLGWQRHDSMYIMLLPCLFFLFRLLLNIGGKASKALRNIALIIYLVHPLCIVLVRGIGKASDLTSLLVDNSMIHYAAVVVTSVLCALSLLPFINSRKDDKNAGKGRAWAEIRMENLRNNVEQFRGILPQGCKIMAVVKANAYGHGDVEMAAGLNKLGVNAFAVATVEEGARLRRKGITGEILILGYTFPEEFSLLKSYSLTQTVIDSDYAAMLNSHGGKIRVHVKIDTGMHRLGVNSKDIDGLLSIYNCKNLAINGTFTHLSSCDSLLQEDVDFTLRQIEQFYKTLDKLKQVGINPGRVHLQSSYGVLNYPYLQCDYARIGIALYGVLSDKNHVTRVSPCLSPVLSIKARVVLTKVIEEGDKVGYGGEYTAGGKMRIAVVAIGYGDGIPRNLSAGKGHVLIRGEKARIIGRICMDQMMVDISNIPRVVQGDIATVIGRDGRESISAESVAACSGTLTNELLSRLGQRIVRKVTGDSIFKEKRIFTPELRKFYETARFSIKSPHFFSMLHK